jgi:hypothetical protein
MNNAHLNIMLASDFSTHLNYDPKTGLQATCSSSGIIWNTRSAFEGVRCRINFFQHDPEKIASIAADAAEHGLPAVCGGLLLSAGLKRETFMSDGDELSLDAIEINLFVSQGECDKIKTQFAFCSLSNGSLSLNVSFTHWSFASKTYGVNLSDLDVSGKSEYPVTSFELGWGRDNKTVTVPRGRTKPSLHMHFQVAEVRMGSSVAGSKIDLGMTTLRGRLTCKEWNLTSDDEDIEIREFEHVRWQSSYPAEAYSGTIQVFKSGDRLSCLPTLYATRDDLLDLRKTLMGMTKGDSVSFGIHALADGIPDEGKEVYLDVVSYSPYFVKAFERQSPGPT